MVIHTGKFVKSNSFDELLFTFMNGNSHKIILFTMLIFLNFCLVFSFAFSDIAYQDIKQPGSMPLMELTVPEEVNRVARKGLAEYLENISPEAMNEWGLSSKEQFKDIVLMAPYKIYTIPEDYLLNYTFETDFLTVLDPLCLWYFPVKCAGRYKAMLQVKQKDGIWQMINISHRRLARDLQTIEKQWNRTNGYNLALFIIDKQETIFVIINKLDKTELFPVDTTRRSLPFEPELYEPYEVIKIIKRYIE